MSKLIKHHFLLDGPNWDLSSDNLTELPLKQLKLNPKATQIDLSINKIQCLPANVGVLTHLTSLDLSRNQLTCLPESFGNLTKLKHLDLYSNQLKTLPLSFGNLTRLKWLDLKKNPLETELKNVAGDCINAKQCEACASRVVPYMKSLSQMHQESLRLQNEAKEKEKLEQTEMSNKTGKKKSKKKKEPIKEEKSQNMNTIQKNSIPKSNKRAKNKPKKQGSLIANTFYGLLILLFICVVFIFHFDNPYLPAMPPNLVMPLNDARKYLQSTQAFILLKELCLTFNELLVNTFVKN